MGWLRRHYGAGPVHLVGLLATLAVAAYAATRVVTDGGYKAIALWFVLCVVIHDFVGWPLYTLADRTARRVGAPGARRNHKPGGRPQVPWINHLRAPTVVSGVLLVMFFPLVFRLSEGNYLPTTGFTEDVYLTNWLLVTLVLFGGSALLYLVRWAIHSRSPRPVRNGPGAPD